MAPIYLSFASAAALLWCALADDGELAADSLPSDEACDAADPDCALSFAQLRAARLATSSPGAGAAEAEAAPGEAPALAQAGAASAKEALESRRESSLAERLGLGGTSLVETLQNKSAGNVGGVMTGYHQTSPEFCEEILETGFRPGTWGWCGAGVYFAVTQAATYTKAVGAHSHVGCMLKAKVNMGKPLKSSKRTCDQSLNGEKVQSMGYNSVIFNPGDGPELVVYDPSQILSIEKVWSKADGDNPHDEIYLKKHARAVAWVHKHLHR